MMHTNFDRALKIFERCKGCECCISVKADSGGTLSACCHEPYTDKWILEIDKCPKPQGALIEEAKPKPMITTAHWIRNEVAYVCSNCQIWTEQDANVCPGCKAKMIGVR